MGFSNTIAVANDKGGVGKTATVANLGGLAAEAGMRTLVVDLDAQGNLGSDLGLRQRGATDGGAGLFATLTDGAPLAPLPTGRPDLDVVTAGEHTNALEDLLRERGPAALYWALEPVVRTYDLVFLDTPPKLRHVLVAGLTVADHLLVPIRSGAEAFDGLLGLSQLFLEVRDGEDGAPPLNPNLEIIGVFLHAVNLNASRKAAEAAALLRAEIGDDLPLRTVIRHLDKPVLEMEEWGELAHEYEAALTGELQERLAALAQGERPEGTRRAPSVAGLVEDYRRLFREVMARLTDTDARRRAA